METKILYQNIAKEAAYTAASKIQKATADQMWDVHTDVWQRHFDEVQRGIVKKKERLPSEDALYHSLGYDCFSDAIDDETG